MIHKYAKTFFIFSFFITLPVVLAAKGDFTAQQPIVKKINLGNSKNALRYYPDFLSFETGKLYKLIIKNPSSQKHYFTAEALSRSVFTRKVQVMNSQNKTIAEVKGHINEIEVYPGGTTEWWFVPIKTLNNSSLHCSIKGHSEAGMTGNISIK
jgi:uncharacterized cupredoxin-like copper-binding protein